MVMNRFDRQIILKDFGVTAQQKLQDAKLLIIGAGGLGCPALLYLAAAGVGTITIVDGDVVQASNLNRQIIFGEKDLDKYKAIVASQYINDKYSDIVVNAVSEFVSTKNIVSLIKSHDIVIDGTDNFATRYLINDACVLLEKPLVFGAIYQNEGQVALFNVADENGTSTNYRDVFPHPPKENQIPNCNETGVLGVLPGIVGVMMATEAIKHIAGYGKTLKNKLLVYNLLHSSFHEIVLAKHPDANAFIPKTIVELEASNYGFQCAVSEEITWQQAIYIYLQNKTSTVFIDVREQHEQPKLSGYSFTQIPLKVLEENKALIAPFEQVIVFCQTGIRSKQAVKELALHFPDKNILSIKGGMNSFEEKK
jgi:adenylyltransferase/sulfurtransferase